MKKEEDALMIPDKFSMRQMLFVDDPIDFQQDTNQSTGAERLARTDGGF